jgi:cellobiose-specific phosphotransferase system component IIC
MDSILGNETNQSIEAITNLMTNIDIDLVNQALQTASIDQVQSVTSVGVAYGNTQNAAEDMVADAMLKNTAFAKLVSDVANDVQNAQSTSFTLFGPLGIILLIVIILVIGVILYFVFRKKKVPGSGGGGGTS